LSDGVAIDFDPALNNELLGRTAGSHTGFGEEFLEANAQLAK
jgi:hypothetical protein